MTGSAAPALRLFFALWPDPMLERRLQAHQQLWRWGDKARPSAAGKLHLTLLFMDGVDPSCLPRLREIGAEVARQARDFTLTLDQAAVWRHGGIAHLAPAQPPAELLALHQALRQQVIAAAVACDRRAFHPHLTLARRAEAAQAPVAFAALPWHADRLVLAQSMLGQGRYEHRASWALGQATPA